MFACIHVFALRNNLVSVSVILCVTVTVTVTVIIGISKVQLSI